MDYDRLKEFLILILVDQPTLRHELATCKHLSADLIYILLINYIVFVTQRQQR